MGLDQFLTRKIYVGGNFEHNEVSGEINIKQRGENLKINLNKLTYINEEAGYWRKCNQIHYWFVQHVQGEEDDCGEYYVSREKLKELLNTCKAVLKEKDKAGELLPTRAGFFFGGTEYDEWYFKDIKETIKILEEALKDERGDFYYSSSW